MQIESIRIQNFRNFEKFETRFGPGLNVVTGNNGTGKSNLLEALCYLSLPRSFRGARDGELVRFGAGGFGIQGDVQSGHTRHRIAVSRSKEAKHVAVDGKFVRSFGKLLRFFVVLPFSGMDNWVDGPPIERRRMFDRYLSAASTGYYNSLLLYRRALKQKNAALRNGLRAVSVWNRQMEQHGKELLSARRAFVSRVQARLHRGFIQKEPTLDYRPSTQFDEGWAERHREAEQRTGQALAGPHRDRYNFSLDGRGLAPYGSDGEKRAFLLCLVLSVRDTLDEILGERPVLALDEPSNVLDSEVLERFVDGLEGQVIMTALERLGAADGAVRIAL